MHCEYRPRSGSPLAPSRFLVRTAMASRSQSESERENVYTSIHDMQLIHVSNVLDKCLDGRSSRINVGSPQYIYRERDAWTAAAAESMSEVHSTQCSEAIDTPSLNVTALWMFTCLHCNRGGGRRRESKERESKYV